MKQQKKFDLGNVNSSYDLKTNKGRLELRITSVCNIEPIKDWESIKSFIMVERVISSKKGLSQEKSYFISSLDDKNGSEFFAKGIRGHWSIESSLHYVKDVVFKEDDSKIVKGSAPENMSIFRNIAINIFRKNGFKSIIQATRLLSNDINALWTIINE